jgi:hypothetical protein
LCFCMGPVSDRNPPTHASCVAGSTGMYYHAQLLGWNERNERSLLLFVWASLKP